MMRRIAVTLGAVVLFVAAAMAMAKNFWDKPYTEWKKSEAFKMLNDSPWAQSQTMATATGGKIEGMDRGVSGDREIYSSFVVRFFSALPIRAAYARTMQLMNNYDAKSDAEKAEIDAKFSRVLKLDFSKAILVALEFSTNDQQKKTDVMRYLDNAKVDLLKQSCYLISDRIGRVQIEEYYPPSPDGTGAKFVFPRTVNDQPVVLPTDKELKFDLWMEPVETRVFVTFKPKNMLYNGELAF